MLDMMGGMPFRSLDEVPTDGTPVLIRLVYCPDNVLHDAEIMTSFYRDGQGVLAWAYLEPRPSITAADMLGWQELEDVPERIWSVVSDGVDALSSNGSDTTILEQRCR